jgi:alcohol dehydrogenase class IV
VTLHLRFVYQALPTRVVFGAGALARLREEVERLGIARALVVSTPGRSSVAGAAVWALAARAAGLYDRAAPHVPAEIAADARAAATAAGADGLVAVGGGSTIGLAKAIALTSGLPIVAVPTTFSGSEMTPIYGITDGGRKQTGRDARVLPRTVIYDPDLYARLPASIAAASGLNALAHCVEALYAADANPIASLIAEEGARALAASLPSVVHEPGDGVARFDALRGAWLAGMALASVGMALHHKLCHTLGGSFGLPHAATHAVILPHAAAYNRDAAPDAMRCVSRALGADDAAGAIYDLARTVDAPASLAEIGMPESGLAEAARLATLAPYPNPRPVDRDAVLALLRDAFDGRRPG